MWLWVVVVVVVFVDNDDVVVDYSDVGVVVGCCWTCCGLVCVVCSLLMALSFADGCE